MTDLLNRQQSLEYLLQEQEAERAYHVKGSDEYTQASEEINSLLEQLQQVDEDIESTSTDY